MDTAMTDEQWDQEESVEIAAPPERVWALVSDVARTGEWSPVCRRCEWLHPSTRPDVGARFVGHNRRGPFRWSRECVVTASEPGEEFAFTTLFKGQESTHWRYRLEPTPSGTWLTESYRAVSMPRWVWLANQVPGQARRSERDARANLRESLARLKQLAEV
jgi:uncharacterized protein YndB with AHSA1/START domain